MHSSRALAAVLLTLAFASAAYAQGIPVRFSLERAGYITLVVDSTDRSGDAIRVRNLIEETFFEAGEHTVYWDGYGFGEPVYRSTGEPYDVVRRPVAPRAYRVRGLFHEGFEVNYEFSVYMPGAPAWQTGDRSGGWLGEHDLPTGLLFLARGGKYLAEPHVVIGSGQGEVNASAAWVSLDGRKVHGSHPAPGSGVRYFAADRGPRPYERYDGYAVNGRRVGGGESAGIAGLYSEAAHNNNSAEHFAEVPFDNPNAHGGYISGMAAWNGKVLLANHLDGWIAVVDAREKKLLGRIAVANPRGIDFLPDGRLVVAQGTDVAGSAQAPQLVAYRWSETDPLVLREPAVLVRTGLEAPWNVRVVGDEVYVGDHGFRRSLGRLRLDGTPTEASHQVKVFGLDGRFRRVIGAPGGPQLGAYDETRMHSPNGFDVDSRGVLWVAESDQAPRRISRWNARTGAFIDAFYGNAKYGGGGTLDPRDKTRMFYSDNFGHGAQKWTIEFKLDWARGTGKPHRILYRTGDEYGYDRDGVLVDVPGYNGPETPHYVGDRLYLSNFSMAGGGRSPELVGLFQYDPARGFAPLVAMVGRTGAAPFMGTGAYAALWSGLHPTKTFFSWSDTDHDGALNPAEVEVSTIEPPGSYTPLELYSFAVMNDLTVTQQAGFVFTPTFDAAGVPRYGIRGGAPRPLTPVSEWMSRAAPGAAEILLDGDRAMAFGGPIAGYSLAKNKLLWRYHVPARAADVGIGGFPRKPSEIYQMMRYVNLPFAPCAGETGGLVGVSAYHGSIHVMTTDGFYVTDLGADSRIAGNWMDLRPTRGTNVKGTGMRGESYGHSLNLTNDCKVVLQGGGDTNLFTVNGFESVRRLDLGEIVVTESDLAGIAEQRDTRASTHTSPRLDVQLHGGVVADGDLSEWKPGAFVTLSAEAGLRAALSADGDHLYAAFRVPPAFFNNPMRRPSQEAFAEGGGLEILISGSTDINQGNPAQVPFPGPPRPLMKGDQRLFVTHDGARFRTYLYEQVNPTASPADAYVYASPIDTVAFARAVEVTEFVDVAARGGDVEVQVPLDLLGTTLWEGKTVLGDLGAVVGSGTTSRARYYWSNRLKTSVNDLPEQARLHHAYWGVLRFTSAAGGAGAGQGAGPAVRATVQRVGGAEVAVGAVVRFTATAEAFRGRLTSVELWEGNRRVAAKAEAPYTFEHTIRESGAKAMTVRAFTEDGDFGISEAVSVVAWAPMDGGWSSADLFEATSDRYDGTRGAARRAGDVIQVTGVGAYANVNNSGATNYHYVYQRVRGDFDFSVAVGGMQPQIGRVAGIAVRASLSNPAVNGRIAFMTDGTVEATSNPKGTWETVSSAKVVYRQYPVFLRVTRTGRTVTYWHSNNGAFWRPLATHTLELGDEALVGLYAVNGAGNAAAQTRAFFQNARLNGERIGRANEVLNVRPRVTLAPPAPVGPNAFALEAAPADDDGTIARVEFFANSRRVGVRTSAPYRITWAPTVAGAYRVVARAFDAQGARRTTTPIDITAAGAPERTQVIALRPGWNLVARTVEPAEARFDSLLAGVRASVVLVRDRAGAVYAPELGVDGLGAWLAAKSYAIYARAAATITLRGAPIETDGLPVSLEAGWNHIPFFASEPIPVAVALAPFGDGVVLVKDAAGGVYLPALGVDMIGALQPGRGYQVYVSQGGTLVYPSASALGKGGSTDPAAADTSGALESSFVLLHTPALADGTLVWAETAAGLRAGSARVSGGRALLVLRGDDAMTVAVDGAVDGATLVLRAEGEEAPVELRALRDVLTGERLAPALRYGAQRMLEAETAERPVALALEQNAPNPARHTTAIRYALPAPVHVRLDVFDLLGRRVATLVDAEQPAGVHTLHADASAWASGVYVYRLAAGAEHRTMRLVVSR